MSRCENVIEILMNDLNQKLTFFPVYGNCSGDELEQLKDEAEKGPGFVSTSPDRISDSRIQTK